MAISQLLFIGGLAHSWEKSTFFGGFEFDYTADGVAPVQNPVPHLRHRRTRDVGRIATDTVVEMQPFYGLIY